MSGENNGWVDAGELDRALDTLAERETLYGDVPAPMAKEGVKFDTGKRRVDLVPTEAINALADILTAGAVKYGRDNWRRGMDWSRVYGAAQRHMLAFWVILFRVTQKPVFCLSWLKNNRRQHGDND